MEWDKPVLEETLLARCSSGNSKRTVKQRMNVWSARGSVARLSSSGAVCEQLNDLFPSPDGPQQQPDSPRSPPIDRVGSGLTGVNGANDSSFLNMLQRGPGLLIGITMNIMLSVPFGLALFPSDWEPFPVPKAIGLQMFLFSTFISQVVMTFQSNFPQAMGMMMVENIPFMHSIAQSIVAGQGAGIEALSTTMVAFALSTILMGVCFMALGRYQLGRAVSYFPRHFIIGCIGGIGIFVVQTGVEVSTGVPWAWKWDVFEKYCAPHIGHLFLVSLALVLVLNVCMRFVKYSLFPPLFFVGILPCFYMVLWCLGVSADTARSHGWLFDHPPSTDFWLMWTLIDLRVVRWDLILDCAPTFVALVCFGLMHAPINIPSLTMSTGVEADMNQELVVHGWTNLISGCLGGFPNYLCYSNSLLYFKCNGGGRGSGILLSALLAGMFVAGPGAIAYVPRCLAGCLLIHVGIDLTKEAVVDSWEGFDTFEYVSILLITVTMTTFGMTPGLGFGMVLSAISFTLQNVQHCEPVRGVMPATTVRSSVSRSRSELDVLSQRLREVLVMQLQGTLFFGNATALLARCEEILAQSSEEKPVRALILDFTLVRSLESSAAETIAKIYPIAQRHSVVLVYNRGNTEGFPTSSPLSSRLAKMSESCRDLFVVDELDDALACIENLFLAQAREDGQLVAAAEAVPEADGTNGMLPVRQLRAICPCGDPESVQRLFLYFERRRVRSGEVLWYQGAVSDHCFLLSEGLMENELEEEAGSTELCSAGCLIGEYHFLNKERRMGTLRAKQDSVIFVLSAAGLEKMLQQDPYLAFLLAQISIRYLGLRCHHISNRIWDTRCLPI